MKIYENSKVDWLEEEGDRVVVHTPYGTVSAAKVALATNVFKSLVRSARKYVIPVYDFQLVTEPLAKEQRRSIGWKDREGISDAGNQFHYYRLNKEGGILWGGAIDTCTRFSPFCGKAHGGKVVYVMGYTGLGVAATRFGAATMLDLLDGKKTERTTLKMVRRKPLPFPPEPFRYVFIWITQWSIYRADQREGRRNLWLRILDKIGLGFDS